MDSPLMIFDLRNQAERTKEVVTWGL